MPSSPRGWTRWAFRILEAQAVPRGVKFGGAPGGDRRMTDSRETALSVKMLLEKSRNGYGGRGVRLLVRLYLGEEPWECFTESQKYAIRKTERRFRHELVSAGFLDPPAPR